MLPATKPRKTKVVTAPGSNWKALKQVLRPAAPTTGTNGTLKRKRSHSESSPVPMPEKRVSKGKEREDFEAQEEMDEERVRTGATGKARGLDVQAILEGGKAAWQAEPGQYLAIDCEMVGVGPEGSESTLARVSIVNYHGALVLDRFVRPREKVTDYRTWVSGVREEDLRNAPSFVDVQKEVAALIKDRILIGHAISNDTDVLLLSHPRLLTRDTAKYAPLQGLAKTKKPGLKTLAKMVLGVDIQSGEHSSVDDARATMAIYRSQKPSWESGLKTHSKPTLLASTPALIAALDPKATPISGVTKSLKPKTLGLAATIRHARNEVQAEEAEKIKMGVEEAEAREAKKKDREDKDGLVLGFDYSIKPVVKKVPVVKVVKKKEEGEEKKKVRKVAGRAFKGDREKRPKSTEGWWEE